MGEFGPKISDLRPETLDLTRQRAVGVWRRLAGARQLQRLDALAQPGQLNLLQLPDALVGEQQLPILIGRPGRAELLDLGAQGGDFSSLRCLRRRCGLG